MSFNFPIIDNAAVAATEIDTSTVLTGYTAGSVLFSTGTAIGQDNTNFFWDDTDNQLQLGDGTAALPAYTFNSSGGDDNGMYLAGTGILGLSTVGVERMTIDATGDFTFTQGVSTSGSPLGFTFTGAAHTTLAASTEATSVYFDLLANVQFATGALTNQRAFWIDRPSYRFVATSTITYAATLYVSGAPLASTNATITNAYALWLGAGSFRTDGTILAALGSASAAAYSFQSSGTADADTGIYSTGAGNVSVAANETQVASFTATGTALAQVISVSGSPVGLSFTGSAHTTLAASTEASDVDFRLDRAVQFATGALATQRAFQIAAPTYGFVGASTLTDAATFYVEGAPVAGTNATITNSYAVWVDAGTSRFDGVVLVSGGSMAAPGIAFQGFTGTGITHTTGEFSIAIAGAERLRITNSIVYSPVAFASAAYQSSAGTARCTFQSLAGFTIAQTAQTSGTNTLFTATGAAHTSLTLSTEVSDVNFNLAREVQFATGALVTQRAFRIQAPTYGFVGASTLTTAATVAISGGPTQGTNATISQSINLHMEGGAVTLASATGALSATILCAARTVTFTGTTQITNGVNSQVFAQSITYTDASAVTMDVASTIGLSGPIGAGSVAITQACGIRMADNVSYATHAADFLYNGIRINNHTVTFTATTQITSTATAGIFVGQITLTNAGVHTIDNAASIYVAGPLIAGGSVTITNNYAIWVDAGIARFDGDGTTVFAVPTVVATDTTITRKIRILDGATPYWVAATTSQ